MSLPVTNYSMPGILLSTCCHLILTELYEEKAIVSSFVMTNKETEAQ